MELLIGIILKKGRDIFYEANLLVFRATALCIGSEILLSRKLRCKKFQ